MDEKALKEQWEVMSEKQRFQALVQVHRELTALAETRSTDLASHDTAIEDLVEGHVKAIKKLQQEHADNLAAALAKQYRDVMLPIKQAEHRRQLAELQARQEAELKSV